MPSTMTKVSIPVDIALGTENDDSTTVVVMCPACAEDVQEDG